MKITFMIGNGFDISAGVDTTYRGFYKWYCDQPSEKEHIKKFKERIKEDIDAGSQYWADFEVALGQYTECFKLETVDDFLDCFNDAQNSIAKYLSDICEKNDYPNKGDIVSSAKNALAKYYSSTSPAERRAFEEIENSDLGSNSEIQFISFNYTDILDRYVKLISQSNLRVWKYGSSDRFLKVNPRVIHAHGLMQHFPILGVNDESQIANKELLSVPNFSNIVIKPKCVASIGELWHEEAETTLSNSKIICVYGMSLGSTDAKWWRKLFEWLKANNSKHIILFCYSTKAGNSISVRDKIITQDEVINTFLSYSNANNEVKNLLKSRIHVCINNNEIFPLKLKEVQADVAATSVVNSPLVLG